MAYRGDDQVGVDGDESRNVCEGQSSKGSEEEYSGVYLKSSYAMHFYIALPSYARQRSQDLKRPGIN